jgi:hypothetical protein
MTVYAVNDDAFLGIPYNAKKEKKKSWIDTTFNM